MQTGRWALSADRCTAQLPLASLTNTPHFACPAGSPAAAGSLLSAAGDRFSVRLPDGRLLRCKLPLAPAGPLPAAPLAALQLALDPGPFHCLLQAYLAHPRACCGASEGEWAAFSDALLAWIGGDAGGGGSGTGADGDAAALPSTPLAAARPGAPAASSGGGGGDGAFGASPASSGMDLGSPEGMQLGTPASGVPSGGSGRGAMQLATPGSGMQLGTPGYGMDLGTPGGDGMGLGTPLGRGAMAAAGTPSGMQLQTPASGSMAMATPGSSRSGMQAATPARGARSAGGAGGAAGGIGGGAWEALLASDTHRRAAGAGRWRWAPATAAAASPVSLQHATATADGANPAHAAAAGNASGYAAAAASFTAYPSRKESLLALEALHSVYEDFKLNTLTWPLLPRLGASLAALACRLRCHAYWEHYARDLGAAELAARGVVELPLGSAPLGSNSAGAAQGSQMSAQVVHKPADVLRALAGALAGDGGGQAHLPLLAARGAACCARSHRLWRCYQLLAGCAASCCALQAPQALRLAGAAGAASAGAPQFVLLVLPRAYLPRGCRN